MRRRDFISLLGGTVTVWPALAKAQSTRNIPHIGILWHAANAEQEEPYLSAIIDGLRDVGYVDGSTVVLEHRFPNEQPDQFRKMAAELVALLVALMLVPNQGWSQQGGQSGWNQQGGQSGAHRSRGQAKENPAIPAAPAIEATSPLGQGLATCDKEAAVEETFALPGLKSEVTLDRCYKGHTHLICVFDALIAEAKSLTDSYTPIVDAKYPDFNSVENICQIKPDILASHMAGAEDFTKRFAMLKSKYESTSKCAINIKQSFRDVVLSDMTQPPEILKSMTESIEGDVARVSDVENQTVDLAAKIDAAKKAMKTIEKIYRAMCVKDKTTVVGRAGVDPAGH